MSELLWESITNTHLGWLMEEESADALALKHKCKDSRVHRAERWITGLKQMEWCETARAMGEVHWDLCGPHEGSS